MLTKLFLSVALALSAQTESTSRPAVFPEQEIVVGDSDKIAQRDPEQKIDIVTDVQDSQVPLLLKRMWLAQKNQEWQMFTALGLMILVWILRKVLLDPRIRKLAEEESKNESEVKSFFKASDVIPWATLLLSVAGAALTALQAGVPVTEALMAGVVVGGFASGSWSLVGKHVERVVNIAVEKGVSWWTARKIAAADQSKGTEAPKTEVSVAKKED